MSRKSMKKLPQSFYLRNDVVKIARELLGKVLVTNWNKEYSSGRIVETEAKQHIAFARVYCARPFERREEYPATIV